MCTDCPAYVATQADDREALERTAAQWREAFNASDITADSIICDGCLEEGGRECGHCSDYTCEKVEGFFGFAPDARLVLDEIRRSL